MITANLDFAEWSSVFGDAKMTTAKRQTLADLFGAQPNALTFDRRGKRLFVCNGTQNAVAVVALAAPMLPSVVAGLAGRMRPEAAVALAVVLAVALVPLWPGLPVDAAVSAVCLGAALAVAPMASS